MAFFRARSTDVPSAKTKPTTPSRRRVLLTGLLIFIALAGSGVWYVMQQHNFHVVVAGQIYRSAQLERAALLRVIAERDIKTIINLRGPGVEDWYNAETNATQQLGLTHIDFTLSAEEELTDVQMDNLMAKMQNAPKPILIHCKSGSDRTGLAGALYLYTFEGRTAEDADQELTLLRGHFPHLFWRDTIAMDRSFWRYVGNHTRQPGDVAVKNNSPLLKQTLPAVAVDH